MIVPKVLPRPKKVVFYKQTTMLPSGVFLEERALPAITQKAALGRFFNQKGMYIEATYEKKFGEETYCLRIDETGISVKYGSKAGAFYALVTLRQIFEQSTEQKIFCGEIFDEPDFPSRGLMLDISRNRIPSVETLKKIIDFISSLKMNELQLYIEGKSFLYPSLQDYYAPDCDVLTVSDVRLLDKYCRERFVEFVPNQNTFGHMTEWLAEKSIHSLSECPEGFMYYGIKMPPSTLDPTKSESIGFIRMQLNDLLSAFSSDKVNIGGDEPFELGEGNSAGVCRKKGKGTVYFEFMQKVFSEVAAHGKRAMMWGDVIKEYPDLFRIFLPDDITVLEWGYDAGSFTDQICELYEKAGTQYYLCPGTSLWNTVTGKTENMRENIKSAARLGKKHRAKGLLLTDWGDGGSCQPFVFAFLPYATGAAYSWNSAAEQDEVICDYLNGMFFKDKSGSFAQILADLGNYYHCADRDDPNATKIFKTLYVQQTDCMNVTEGNYEPLFFNRDFERLSARECLKTLEYLRVIKARAENVSLECSEGKQYFKEFEWAVGYLIHGCKLGAIKADNRQFARSELEEMKEELARLNADYVSIWKERNKQTGIEQSMFRMNALYKKYEAILN